MEITDNTSETVQDMDVYIVAMKSYVVCRMTPITTLNDLEGARNLSTSEILHVLTAMFTVKLESGIDLQFQLSCETEELLNVTSSQQVQCKCGNNSELVQDKVVVH